MQLTSDYLRTHLFEMILTRLYEDRWDLRAKDVYPRSEVFGLYCVIKVRCVAQTCERSAEHRFAFEFAYPAAANLGGSISPSCDKNIPVQSHSGGRNLQRVGCLKDSPITPKRSSARFPSIFTFQFRSPSGFSFNQTPNNPKIHNVNRISDKLVGFPGSNASQPLKSRAFPSS